MSTDASRKPNYNRRFLWLALFIVVLFGGYSAGWFYLAGKLENEARANIANLNRNGVVAECTNVSARGFPFRLGLFCDRIYFEDARQGVSIATGSFRSVGQIYDPRHLVGELDGPARIDVPQIQPLALDWGNLRASVRLAQPLPQRLSVEGKELHARTVTGTELATIKAFESHMRPNGANIDLASSFSDLTLDPSVVGGRTVPPLSGQSDITVNNGVQLINERVQSLRGQSGTIRMLDLSTGESTGLSLTGTFSVAQDGLLDADLRVTVRDPQGMATSLGNAIPELRKQIQQGFMALAILGDSPSMPLKISRGKATLGFIKLGRLPPLQ